MRSETFLIMSFFVSGVLIAPTASLADAPNTTAFMNALTVCGAGISITLDANLKGSLKSLYEGEATQGKAVQEIIPKISDALPEGDNYQRYVDCLDKLLSK